MQGHTPLRRPSTTVTSEVKATLRLTLIGLDRMVSFEEAFHQEQPDGFSYAVDLRIVKRGITTDEVTQVAHRYGIRPTVKGEWWHFQPRNGNSWFNKGGSVFLGTEPEPPEPEVNWAGIQAIIDDMGRQIAVSPIRRGSKGDIVKVVQSKLNSLDFDCGIADGVYGRKTLRAVLMLQRSLLLKERGYGSQNMDSYVEPGGSYWTLINH